MSMAKSQFEDVIKERRIALIEDIGLSKKCVDMMQKTTRTLCDPQKAKRRIKNLRNLGFDLPIDLIESNPTLINRKVSTVDRRFRMVQLWMETFNKKVDIHELFYRRPQLWSVGGNKLLIIFLLCTKINGGVTPERICNLITLNLEDLLITFMLNQKKDCVTIHRLTRERRHDVIERHLSKQKKQKTVLEGGGKLPKIIYAEYCLRYLA
jgi:hypothetical protein